MGAEVYFGVIGGLEAVGAKGECSGLLGVGD